MSLGSRFNSRRRASACGSPGVVPLSFRPREYSSWHSCTSGDQTAFLSVASLSPCCPSVMVFSCSARANTSLCRILGWYCERNAARKLDDEECGFRMPSHPHHHHSGSLLPLAPILSLTSQTPLPLVPLFLARNNQPRRSRTV